MSAFPPSAAIVKAARQIDLAPSGNVSNSLSAALIHETGRVFRVIRLRSSSGIDSSLSLAAYMLSYLTTIVKRTKVGSALTHAFFFELVKSTKHKKQPVRTPGNDGCSFGVCQLNPLGMEFPQLNRHRCLRSMPPVSVVSFRL